MVTAQTTATTAAEEALARSTLYRFLSVAWCPPDDGLDELTRFITKDGTEIALAPGRTWVELLPSTVEVSTMCRKR